VLKAAGESTRLRLLALLADGEQSVKDLTEILGQSQPRVSRHLKLLADAGLIVRHAEGAWAYYGLAAEGAGGELARWLVTKADEADPERRRDRERLKLVRTQQQAQAADFFAKVAESWDQLRLLHGPEEAVETAVRGVFADRVIDTLFDLGTGTGRMLELLAPCYRRGVGIDTSREMMAVARAKLAGAGIAHAQVRLGDILDLDPGLGRADAVVLHQVLHYFDDPGRLLTQVKTVLNPGGEVLIVDFLPHAHEFLRSHQAHRRLGMSLTQISQWAAQAGLGLVSETVFPPGAVDEGLTVALWHLRALEGQ
jgi:ArsR family transcriptional regulator